MKKLVTLLFLVLGMTAFAQEKAERRNDLSNDEMATLSAKRLSMQLDLNEKQQADLKSLYLKRIQTRAEMKDKMKEDREEIKENRQQVSEEMKADLKKILSEEQYLKWEQLQEKRRKGRQAPMKQREN